MYIHAYNLYMYVQTYIKINEKQKLSFSLLLRYVFTAVATLQAEQSLLINLLCHRCNSN